MKMLILIREFAGIWGQSKNSRIIFTLTPNYAVGECIHGRGGLEADDTYFRPKVKERLVPVIAELERRKANWKKGPE